MNLRWRSASSRSAMMMMELMIVVALIFVLFTLYWGGGFGRKTNKHRDFAGCSRNLQFIHTSLLTYAADHDEKFPFVPRAQSSEEPLALLIPKYTSQTASFICPASEDTPLPEGESFARRKISYAYVMGLSRTNDPYQFVLTDKQIDSLPKPQGAFVFATNNKPPGNNHGGLGGNVLLIDGSVRTIKAKAEFPLTYTNAILLNPRK